MAKHETLWALNEYLRVIDDTPLNNKIIYKLMLATNISLKFEGYLKDERAESFYLRTGKSSLCHFGYGTIHSRTC